jgi:hypothetical protein
VVVKRQHILVPISGATVEWMDNEAHKHDIGTASLLTLSTYWEKRNASGHGSSSDELDNVLKAIELAGCIKDDRGRYTYRGNIFQSGKLAVGTVIVNPYGRKHEGKTYFCFTEAGVYLANPPLVNTADPKYNSNRGKKLQAIAEKLYKGELSPASHEDEDDELVNAAYEQYLATYHAGGGSHAAPSVASRPGSRGSATGQPAAGYGYGAQQSGTGSRPSSSGNAGPARPVTPAYHGQQQGYQQPHPQQQGYQQQSYQQQQQGYQQQGYHQPMSDFHPTPFAHAGPSQPAPAPAAQTAAASLPYHPQYLALPGKRAAHWVLLDPDTEHLVIKGMSDSKPDKAYQLFWSDERKKFYILKTVSNNTGKRTERVYLDDPNAPK